jgi:hypothetical protein
MAKLRSYRPVPRRPVRNFSDRRQTKTLKIKLVMIALLVLFLIYALFAWILPELIGGLSFLNRYKASSKPTSLISESPTLAPPVLNIPFEATNTATIRVKGYAQPLSKVEIYVDDELKDTTETSLDGNFNAESVDLSLGTNNVYGKTVDDKDNKSLPSKSIKVIYNNEKPKLDLSSPADDAKFKGGDQKVTVSGSTNPGNTLTANGLQIIVGTDGNFSQSIPISEGENNITITSTDSAGNTTSVSRKVTYEK